MATTVTAYREYRRGFTPDDFTALWAPATFRVSGIVLDGGHRNRLLAFNSSAALSALVWNAPEADAGHANQEAATLCRLIQGQTIRPLVLRAGGTPGAETGYFAQINSSTGTMSIVRRVAGAETTVATSAGGAVTLPTWTWVWVRFRANGTTIGVKLWGEFDAEPGSFTVSGTDSAIADGRMGIAIENSSATRQVEHRFFGVATNGDTVPGLAALPRPMSQWANDPGAQIEYTVQIDSYSAADKLQQTLWYSSSGRRTPIHDYPPKTEMDSILSDPGSYTSSLTEDAQFDDAATAKPGTFALTNSQGQLDFFVERTFANRRITVRAGEQGTPARPTLHRGFETVYTALVSGEPEVAPAVATFTLAPRLPALSQNLSRRLYVGIPTCLDNPGNTNLAAQIASTCVSQKLTTFSVLVRFRCRGIIAPSDAALIRRSASATDYQFGLRIGGSSDVAPGKLYAVSAIGGVANGLVMRSLSRVDDSTWHTAIFAVLDSQLAYLMLDGVLQVQAAIAGSPATSNTAGVAMAYNHNAQVCDGRIYNFFLQPSQSQSITLVAADQSATDPFNFGLVGYYRCDDDTGSQVTDYSSAANHLQFVNTPVPAAPVSFQPSDLGESSLAGKVMPIASGALFNQPATLIDSFRARFRIADADPVGMLPPNLGGIGGTLLVVKARGVPLNPSGGSPDFTAPGGGVIDMSAAQSEPVTFDLQPDAGSQAPATVALELIANRTQPLMVKHQDYDPDVFESLRRLIPFPAGYYSAGNETGDAALAKILGPAGCHYRSDREGRFVPGCLLPPLNPGPYGLTPAPEFNGFDSGGIFWQESAPGGFSAASTALGSCQTILFWVYFHHLSPDPLGAGSIFPFCPNGQALIDTTNDALTAGIYVGISKVDGRLLVGTPGFANTIGNTNKYTFSALNYFKPRTWYLVAVQLKTSGAGSNFRSIQAAPVGAQTVATIGADFSPSGAITATSGRTRFAGGGNFGGLWGSLLYVTGFSTLLTTAQINAYLKAPPTAADPNVTWFSPLTEGAGADTVSERIAGRTASLLGCRWNPRAVFDLRKTTPPTIGYVKRLRRLWYLILNVRLNGQIMADADIDPGVVGNARNLLKGEKLFAPWSDASQLADYLNALKLELDSPLYNVGDGAQVVQILVDRLNADRFTSSLTGALLDSFPLNLTDEVFLYSPRYQHDQGRAYRLVSIAPDLKDGNQDLGVWGGAQATEYSILIDSVTGDELQAAADGSVVLAQ